MKKKSGFMLIVAILILASFGMAQTPMSYTLTSEMAEYTIVHTIDVGDRDGHILRVFELVWDQAENDNPPVFNGMEATSIIQRSFADYTKSTGNFYGYDQFVMENGDIIYARNEGTTHTVFNEEGGVANTAVIAVHEIIGGSGEFEGIRGLLRSTLKGEPSEGNTFKFTGVTVEGSYWMLEDMAETSE